MKIPKISKSKRMWLTTDKTEEDEVVREKFTELKNIKVDI